MIRTFLFLGLATGAAYAQTPAVDGATRPDWPHYCCPPVSWRYSALDQINTVNVKSLAPAWILQTGDYSEGLQVTPIVVDGAMYLITARGHVSALDAAMGRVAWDYRSPPRPPGLAGGIAEYEESCGGAGLRSGGKP